MAPNFAHFQQWCFLGSMGNHFADSKAVPRAEAACVVYAQKDYFEHRHKHSLFAAIPDEALHQNADDSDDADSDADAGADAVQLGRKPEARAAVAGETSLHLLRTESRQSPRASERAALRR